MSRFPISDGAPSTRDDRLRLALPKGRTQEAVLRLLADAGMPVSIGSRVDYRPQLRLPHVDAKLLKPQNIVGMLAAGSRDLGFAGNDWVVERLGDPDEGSPVVELLDTGLDPVRLVVAAPTGILERGALPRRPLRIASEYARLAERYIEARACGDTFVRTYGATEVFPPEDADAILDNTATGSTLRANGLQIVEEVLCSSTRLFAHRGALTDPERRRQIEDFVLLVRSVVEARLRVMLEANVSATFLDAVTELLPSMREATVSPLHGRNGYAVKAAVPRRVLAELVPALRAAGASDIVVTQIAQLAP
jgi:ATP phosphoribosyltransferase